MQGLKDKLYLYIILQRYRHQALHFLSLCDRPNSEDDEMTEQKF